MIITGSHNPPEDNGFKMLRNTSSIFGDEIRGLRTAIEAQDFVSGEKNRGLFAALMSLVDYIDSRASVNCNSDPADATLLSMLGTAPQVRLDRQCTKKWSSQPAALFCDMDGRFPNHHPDPTVEENLADLRNEVAKQSAEVGIAFDGDGDRIGVIDGKGRILWGDQLMILFGREILKTIPNATFIGEVKCSQALFDELSHAGGNPIMWKVWPFAD